jgi:tape measure domain-containing protein
MSGTVVDVLARLRADTSNYSTNMKRSAADTTALAKSAEKMGSAVNGASAVGANALRGLSTVAKVAAAGVGAAFVAAAGMGLSAAAQYEQTVISFEGLFRAQGMSVQQSAAKTEEYLGQLRDFAAKTPFELPGLLDATKRLMSIGFTAEDAADRIIPAIGDITSALGQPPQAIEAVAYAFGQMRSAGRIMSQDLMQIGNALPGFNAKAAIAAEMFGGDMQAMTKAVEDGQVDVNQAIDAIIKGMQKFPGAAGAMERQSKSLLGVLSTFKDTARNALIDGLMPAIPAISGALNELVPAVEALAKGFGSSLGPAISTVVTTLTPALLELGKVLGPSLSGLIKALAPILAALLPIITSLVKFIGQFARIIASALEPVLTALGPVLNELVTALGDGLLTAFQALVPQMPALTTAMVELVKAFIPMAPLLPALVQGFVQMVPPLISLMGYFTGLLNAISGNATAMSLLTQVVTALGAGFIGMKVLAPAIAGLRATKAAMGFNTTQAGLLNKAMLGVGQGMRNFASGLRSSAAAESAFSGRMGTLGGKVAGLGTSMKNAALASGKWAKDMVLLGLAHLRTAAGVVASTAATVASKVAGLAVSAATKAWTAAQWLLNAALTANPIGLVIAAIALLAGALYLAWTKSEVFRKAMTAAFQGVLKVITTVWNWVKANWPLLLAILTGPIGLAVLFITKNWDTIKAATQAVWTAITNAISTAVNFIGGLITTISGHVASVVGFFLGLPGRITGAIADIGSWLFEAGKDLIRGLVNGIKNMASAPVNAIRDMGANVVNGLKNVLGINSPSTEGLYVGNMLSKGVEDGIRAKIPGVVTASRELGDMAVGELNAAARAAKAAADQVKEAAAGRTPEPVLRNQSKTKANYQNKKKAERKALADASKPPTVPALSGGGGGGGESKGGGSKKSTAKAKKSAFDAAGATIAAIKAGLKERLVKAKDDLKQIRDSMKQMSDQIRDSIVQFGSVANINLPPGFTKGADYIVDVMKARVKAAQDFAKQVEQLKKAGLNNTSLQEIISAGAVQGGSIAANLLNGGAGTIKQVNDLEKQLAASGNTLGGIASKSQYGSQEKRAADLVNALDGKVKSGRNGNTVYVQQGAVKVEVKVTGKTEAQVERAARAAVNKAFNDLVRELRNR